MPTRTVTVGSASGLHARPAAIFVAAAAAQPVPVTIRTSGRSPVPARSMLSVLSLAAKHGTEVILEADGPAADAALDALAALIVRDLDAEEGQQGDG
ncbi:HPr family phosphocarrier protein [Micromonospora echinaurantiaca]|uniref:HPr family phosphocarrier protein n=1 Tax=Micromonospora echinaurantiaca TaxID=47857 RepID=UPI003713BAD4